MDHNTLRHHRMLRRKAWKDEGCKTDGQRPATLVMTLAKRGNTP